MAPPSPEVRGPSLTNIGRAWDHLRETHATWFDPLQQVNPLYSLTEPIIARLEQPRLGQPPLLNPPAAAAERALNDLCRRCHAVGFFDGLPIVYRFFSPPPPLPSEAEMIAAGWTPAQRRDMRALAQRADDASVRLKGFVGWLLTEPTFLEDCRSLAERWDALPDPNRPRFPLRLGQFHPALPEELRATPLEISTGFAQAFVQFCDRWGLIGMASWDLPEPQGPLLPNPLPPEAPALPRHGVHLIIPVHYPLTGDDDLLRQILQQQRGLAAELGLPPTAAGLAHYRAYATALEVLHWERVIISRIGPRQTRRGSVGFIKDAIAEALGISVDQVDKWRRAISACRRGRRHLVPALKVKT
jgi:hypothetical protein